MEQVSGTKASDKRVESVKTGEVTGKQWYEVQATRELYTEVYQKRTVVEKVL